jgi:aryl-alcohol dehydrogenase-like predicted oxidoreductase
VQNLYNLTNRGAEDVVDYCDREGIGFIPWFPLARAASPSRRSRSPRSPRRTDATTGQVALAWLLQRSPVMLPIPGTGSVEHLEENVAAADLELTAEQVAELDGAGRPRVGLGGGDRRGVRHAGQALGELPEAARGAVSLAAAAASGSSPSA